MALTAARTELNVILQGADETARMLQEARERMQQMETRLRALTAAANAQAGASAGAAGATAEFSDRINAAATAVDGYRDRIDGGIGKVKQYIDLFGDIGDIVSGAIDGYKFLSDAMSDSDEEAARLKKSLEDQAKAAEETRKSIEQLAKAQQEAIVGLRSTGQSALQEQIKLAELQKDEELAASLRRKLEHQAQLDRIAELKEQVALKAEEEVIADQAIRDATRRINDNQRYVNEQQAEADRLSVEVARKKLEIQETFAQSSETGAGIAIALASEIKDSEEKIKNIKKEIFAITHSTIEPEKVRLETATQTFKALINQQSAMRGLLGFAEKVAAALKGSDNVLQMDVLDESKPKRTGGGGGKSKAERDRERAELRDRNRETYLELKYELDERDKLQKRASDSASKGEELFEQQRDMRDRILAELAGLPTDATAKAFDPLRNELKKQLAELDKVMKDHQVKLPYSMIDGVDLEAAGKVLDQWDKEADNIDKVDVALQALNETRAAATAEAEKMADAMLRANISGTISSTTEALQALSAIQAPAFEAISESVAGITAQFGKFKEGQMSLASAIVGSAGAIAGAVANKVLGVREEAGVRALFEGAMGIATAFSNPLESAGHFAAAAAFGAVALGGFKSTPRGGDGGGSKAPAKAAASTRDSTMGGGGGTITNVYNLQTGIVDGQSTAMAFRRAEMTARNTGMASAGGW